MVNIALWMKDFTQAMLDVFGERVLFLGLHGSYRRGEATEESDIDVVAVLDEVRLEDLKRYREALRGLPEGEKAGGFISGRHEMLAWPRHELFQFRQDTRAYYGDLDSLLPGFGEEDIRLSARIGAATLYHGLCHGYVRSQGADTLYSSYKSAFFLLQLMCVLRGMPYASTRAELSTLLEGGDLKVLDVFIHWQSLESDRAARPDFYWKLLLDWCGRALAQLA